MKPSSCTSLVSRLLSWEAPDHSRSTASSHSAGTCTVAWACSKALRIAASVHDACAVDDTEQDTDFMDHPTKKTSCLSSLKAFRACIACLALVAGVEVAFPPAQ